MPDRTRHIPEATVARLPVYLRSLAELVDEKTTTVSSSAPSFFSMVFRGSLRLGR